MKTIESRSTTSRKKKRAVRTKLPSAFPARRKVHKRDMTDAQKVRFLERELHSHIMRSDPPWFSSHGKREVALRNARKQARELKREVARLNALVIKLAEKI
tara:strand:- start:50 stop:352 length:303 start_codon:yes stop_codon:yes gene_type:complete